MPMDESELASVFSKGAENFKMFNSPLPAGERYTFLLKKAELGKSKKGKPQITEIYRVTVGQFEGKELRLFTQLTHEVSWSICLARWIKFGLDGTAINSLKEVEEYCEALTEGQFLCIGLVTDQNGDDGQVYKKLTVEQVSRSKKDEAAPAPTPAPTPTPPAPKAATPAPAAVVPESPAGEEEDEPAKPVVAEDEGDSLNAGDTCDYTFKGVKQRGLVKEMHPAIPPETDDKVTFLTDGKPYKVKVGNIVAIVAKAGAVK